MEVNLSPSLGMRNRTIIKKSNNKGYSYLGEILGPKETKPVSSVACAYLSARTEASSQFPSLTVTVSLPSLFRGWRYSEASDLFPITYELLLQCQAQPHEPLFLLPFSTYA